MFNFGLLSDAALTGLSDTEKESLQKQATTQFLLGSLLSNDASMGLKSALTVPDQYLSGQKAIAEMNEKARQRGELSGFMEKYLPTPSQAGQRALGATGKGPTVAAGQMQQDILNAPIDYQQALTDSLRLTGNPAQAQIRETLTAMQPKFQGDLRVDASGRIVGSLPTNKDGIQTRFNPVTEQYSANPVQNYMLSQILTKPPEVSTNTMLVPLQGGGFVQQAIPGAANAIQTVEGAKAVAQAAGQVEQIVDPITQQKKFVPRSTLLGGTQPNVGGVGGVTGGGGVAEVSPSQKTMNETADARFKSFSKSSQDASDTAGGRKLAAQQLYDLSTRIDNNKLTGIQAGLYSYMNAIPGIGKMFEQDITDVTRMNQAIATAQLEKTAQQKGAASNLDAQVIAKGYATLTDPASATRMLAAQEEALADKDLARQRFIENYSGEPGKITTAWEKAPENQPIFNHPKFNQFLTEQVVKWQQGGSQGAPVMPAGFTVGRSKSSGAILIKKPDGSLFTVGQ